MSAGDMEIEIDDPQDEACKVYLSLVQLKGGVPKAMNPHQQAEHYAMLVVESLARLGFGEDEIIDLGTQLECVQTRMRHEPGPREGPDVCVQVATGKCHQARLQSKSRLPWEMPSNTLKKLVSEWTIGPWIYGSVLG